MSLNNRLEHRFQGGNRKRRNHNRNHDTSSRAVGLSCLTMALLSVLALLGWQYRASLGVLESTTTTTTTTTTIIDPHHDSNPQSSAGALPGSILSVDNNHHGLNFLLQQPPPQSQSTLGKQMSSLSSSSSTNNQRTTFGTKTILYYTKFWGHEDFLFGQGSDVFADCPVSKCRATSKQAFLSLPQSSPRPSRQDKKNFSNFDAVLFHPLDMSQKNVDAVMQQIGAWRQPHQRFVMVHMESPLTYPPREWSNHDGFANFFNWTMTYLWKADIVRPYGYFIPKKQWQSLNTPTKTDFAYAHLPAAWIAYDRTHFYQTLPQRPAAYRARAKRPYQVAWIVSNCHTPSQREDYVAELSKHVNVTVFGRCSNNYSNNNYNQTARMTVQQQQQQQQQHFCDDTCYQHIQNTYKFVLGLENSHCHEYVTEKFFGRVHDFVVIVDSGGGAAATTGDKSHQNHHHHHHHHHNYQRLAPPHSYIDVNDFASPADLAAYLHQLTHDEAAYLSYFWWQDHYQVLAAPGHASGDPAARRHFFAQSMCRLCERLHLSDNNHNDDDDDNGSGSWKVYANVSEWFIRQGRCTVPA